MLRRLFILAAGLSFALFLLLSLALAWGTIAPFEFLFARSGSLWQVTIDQSVVFISRTDPWPRDEPLIRTTEGKRLVVQLVQFVNPGTKFVIGGTGEMRVFVARGSANNVDDVDPWGHTPPGPPAAPARMLTFHILTHRVILLAAALPAIWAWRRLRRRWRPGTCRHCGYDLRASTDRCPECGAPIPAEATA